MNSHEAKRIPLINILASLGYEAERQVNDDVWYFSPFREETQASFKINVERNIWYDFGAGEGGNILDFILKYYHLETIKEALQQLEHLGVLDSRLPTPTVARVTAETKNDLVITRLQPLVHRALIGYLQSRGIATAIARPYVQEMHYTHHDKPYFALTFANESGGYELRNRYYKGCYGHKDISLVTGGNTESQSVAVFEGFMDFLSALTWYGPEQVPRALVFNSLSMRQRATSAIEQMDVDRLTLFLDRDTNGQELTTWFQEQFRYLPVQDASDLYAGYKDFNAFLVANPSRKRV